MAYMLALQTVYIVDISKISQVVYPSNKRKGLVMEWMYPKIGQKIREARRLKHMSQEDIGLAVNLTRTSIVNIEHGRQKVMIHTLYALAEVLDVPVIQLLPLSTDPEEEILSDPLAQRNPAVKTLYLEMEKALEGEK